LLNKQHLYLIAALCIVLTIVLGVALKPKPVPATSHIVEPRIPATRPATATPAQRATLPTSSPATSQPETPQPLGLATMVVGTNTDPHVQVIVITATPAPSVGAHSTPTAMASAAADGHGAAMDTGFGQQQTSPLPTPDSPTATATPLADFLPTPASGVSPLETPAIPSGAPDPDTEQAVYDLLDNLITEEAAYYGQHGHYAQLLISDNATCPIGQACITLDYPPGLLAGVDVYESPSGEGYAVHVNVNGWRLVVAAGPETWRAEAWHYEGE